MFEIYESPDMLSRVDNSPSDHRGDFEVILRESG